MTMPTQADIAAFRKNGSWRKLEQIAQGYVLDAQEKAGIPFKPLLGGGTRIMLALNHRISHDIDLFIRDPQWIGYLTPRLNDRLDNVASGYEETAVSLKLRFPEGEIDFITGMSLLGLPDEQADDCLFKLEPVAEVIAKKLFYRGWALTPRDLFDWWSVETKLPVAIPRKELASLLKSKYPEIENALKSMVQSTSAQTAWDNDIRAFDKPALSSIISWGKDCLGAYKAMLSDQI
jgi:hypothetical protein